MSREVAPELGNLNWVFLHGWGSDASLWQPLCEHLPGTHVFVDLPGFGQGKNGLMSVDDFLDAVHAQLPANCILVGWSLGGMLGVQLARRYPQAVQALVTLAANAVFVANSEWPYGMAETTFAEFLHNFSSAPEATWSRFTVLQTLGDSRRKAVAQAFKQQVPPAPQTVDIWLQGLQWLAQLDNREALSYLANQRGLPQLHLYGENDALVPASAVSSMKALRHPVEERASTAYDVTLLDGIGHAPHLSDPARVAETILCFCQTQIGLTVEAGLSKDRGLDGCEQSHIDSFSKCVRKKRIARAFGDAATQYDLFAHVQRQVAEHLVAQMAFSPADGPVLDLGCGTGYVTQLILQREPMLLQREQEILQEKLVLSQGDSVLPNEGQGKLQQTLLLADLALPMVTEAQRKCFGEDRSRVGVVADAEALPFAEHSLGGILSSLALQWCDDIENVFREAARVLRPGGVLCFSTLGPDTLQELKQAWRTVDGYSHVNTFLSVESLQHKIQTSGLELRAMTRYPLQVTYRRVTDILRDLKGIGAHHVNDNARPGLTSVRHLKQLERAYENFRNSCGEYVVTYDVVAVTAKSRESTL